MKRVVIADDDAEARASMRAALAPLDAEIFEAGSGFELLEIIAFAGPFDLIVADLGIPYLDGRHVVAMARGAGVVTPFLIMTERKPDPSSAPWLREVELLLKPCAGTTLLRAATSILEQRTVSRYG